MRSIFTHRFMNDEFGPFWIERGFLTDYIMETTRIYQGVFPCVHCNSEVLHEMSLP